MTEASRQLRLRVFLTFQRHGSPTGNLDNNQLQSATEELATFDLALADKLRRAVSIWQQGADLDRVMQVVDAWISALEAGQETR